MTNIPTVQRLYQAFGAGDLPGILTHLAEDVIWEYGHSSDVGYLQPRRGKAEVPAFFQALGVLEITRFEPWKFFETDDMVVVLVNLEATVRATGRTVTEQDEVHIWTFNQAGKVSRFGHRLDSYQHWAAVR